MSDVSTPIRIALPEEDPEASSQLIVGAPEAPEVRQLVDLVTAQFRAATVQAAGLDASAVRSVAADRLVSALQQQLANLPASTAQAATLAARTVLGKPSEERTELGPLAGADLAAPLDVQVQKVAASLGPVASLNAAGLASAPVLRHPAGRDTESSVPVARSSVVRMQVGVFLDRIHCWDLTGLGLTHDNIGLLATGIDPEKIDESDPVGSIAGATFGRSYGMGYFSKGDDWPRPFPQPGGQYLHYTEHAGTKVWPRSYVTTLTLIQQNPLASDSLHADLLAVDNALRSKLIDALRGLTIAGLTALGAKLGLSAGLIAGPVGALIGAIVGALVGMVVGALIDWIESYTQNWFFNPASFTLYEAFLHSNGHDWPAHHVDVNSHTGHYSLDVHHYRRHEDIFGKAEW